MRLGIFGGTFDPPHIAHLVVAQEVHWRLGLDRVLWIPAAVPPHKRGRAISPGDVRLEMVRAAIGDDPRFEASDRELRRDGASYTVETLREITAEHPGVELFLMIGADQLAEFDTWREPAEIARLATLVAFARAGEQPGDAAGATVVEIPRLDISSTLVRERAGAGAPIGFLVPAAVAPIIERERLYTAEDSG